MLKDFHTRALLIHSRLFKICHSVKLHTCRVGALEFPQNSEIMDELEKLEKLHEKRSSMQELSPSTTPLLIHQLPGGKNREGSLDRPDCVSFLLSDISALP